MCKLTCDKDGFASGVDEPEGSSVEQQVPSDKPDDQVKSHEQHRRRLQDAADGVGAKEEDAHPEHSHAHTRKGLRKRHGWWKSDGGSSYTRSKSTHWVSWQRVQYTCGGAGGVHAPCSVPALFRPVCCTNTVRCRDAED